MIYSSQPRFQFDNQFENFDVQEFELISGNQRIGFDGSSFGTNQKDLNLSLDNVDIMQCYTTHYTIR